MKNWIYLISFVMTLVLLTGSVSADDWWSNDFTHRTAINYSISENELSTLLNIQYSANMQTDFGDLRFVAINDSGSSIPLGYWFYNNTCDEGVECKIWVKNDNYLNGYVYYGNSTATTTSDITTAFLFGDDFSSAIDWTNDWQSLNQSAYTIFDGSLMVAEGLGASLTNKISSNSTLPSDFYSELRISSNDSSNSAFYISPNEVSLGAYYGAEGMRIACGGQLQIDIAYGTTTGCVGSIANNEFVIASWKKQDTIYYGNFSTDNGVEIVALNSPSPSASGYYSISTYLGNASFVDWVYWTSYNSSLSTAILGIEEQNTLPTPPIVYENINQSLADLITFENCTQVYGEECANYIDYTKIFDGSYLTSTYLNYSVNNSAYFDAILDLAYNQAIGYNASMSYIEFTTYNGTKKFYLDDFAIIDNQLRFALVSFGNTNDYNPNWSVRHEIFYPQLDSEDTFSSYNGQVVIAEKIGTINIEESFNSSEINEVKVVWIGTNLQLYTAPTQQNPNDVTQTPIYQTLNSTGSGIAKLILYIAQGIIIVLVPLIFISLIYFIGFLISKYAKDNMIPLRSG